MNQRFTISKVIMTLGDFRMFFLKKKSNISETFLSLITTTLTWLIQGEILIICRGVGISLDFQ